MVHVRISCEDTQKSSQRKKMTGVIKLHGCLGLRTQSSLEGLSCGYNLTGPREVLTLRKVEQSGGKGQEARERSQKGTEIEGEGRVRKNDLLTFSCCLN